MEDQATREAFVKQAEACESLGSPFTGRLLRGLAAAMTGEGALEARILGWRGDPVADALALRVAGALHGLARSSLAPELERAWPPEPEGHPAEAAREAFARHEAWLAPWLDGPPQTNEVARSGALLGGALALAARVKMPLEWLEIGASAGLNQNFDRFRYDFGEGRGWGDPEARVVVRQAWRGSPPPDAPLDVAARAAVDVAPLDPTDPRTRARLMAYIWPDQPERLARTGAALEEILAHPRPVKRGDAAAWVEARLAAPQAEGTARTLVHTIMWQYMPAGTQGAIRAAMERAGAAATAARPLAWLSMEPDAATGSAALSLTLWPGGEALALARADFHGRWVDWA